MATPTLLKFHHMKHRSFLAVLALAVTATACTIKDTQPPPLAGPSEMALSLAITANPDVLSLDGASQSQIRILARDENGQPKSGILLRAEILVDGNPAEYGALSARTRSTDSNGVTSFTYTAPVWVGDVAGAVQVSITPEGAGFEDASTHRRRLITLRLVPPGVIGVPPTADFSFAPQNPAAFADVRFDASASSGGLGANIVSYVWDFGDGGSGTGAAPTHLYDVPGTYQVKLVVTNNTGLSAQVVKPVTVGAGSAPTASFIVNPTNPSVGATVFFNASTSTAGAGHQIVRYEWDFGNGTKRSGVSVSNVYSAAGTYDVLLIVTDEAGQISQATRPVTVGGSAPSADFVFSPSAPSVNATINFNGSTSTAATGHRIVSWQWNFGDGTTGSGATVSHAYTAAGTYNVVLTVTDEIKQTDQAVKTVTVGSGGGSGATANFSVTPTSPRALDIVTFNGSASTGQGTNPISTYSWNFDCTVGTECFFGNGNTAVFFNTYLIPGTYQVTLTVVDTASNVGTRTQNITVVP